MTRSCANFYVHCSYLGPWSGYGQNLAAGGYGSWSNAIQAWYNEVKDFDRSSVGNFQ